MKNGTESHAIDVVSNNRIAQTRRSESDTVAAVWVAVDMSFHIAAYGLSIHQLIHPPINFSQFSHRHFSSSTAKARVSCPSNSPIVRISDGGSPSISQASARDLPLLVSAKGLSLLCLFLHVFACGF